MPKIELKTEIKADIEIVFDLSRSIDLHKISTEQTKEEAIKGKTFGLIGKGEWVTWRAKHFGFYQTLTSKIVEFERPEYFVDEMEKGAFKSFRHQHYFTKSDFGTLMIDYFEYKSPLGFLGNLADSLFLEKYMKKLLEKRNQTIKEFAESEMWKEVLKK
ncbi:SRPBCC family protein [Muricauda oceani]|uniref:SRPBCC family protein n=1 Tax=Flagellimonas oceani TaxID=2698672 RepID=A0A6G7J0A1_9FLAO|nr:SRPBCC family protein [Allomuricauda oceani]MBW8244816.1 SRPBCC family protein [Allomuricauda oceani]QII43872.1 SRPBCC family protein [Allomuricauda oceani]